MKLPVLFSVICLSAGTLLAQPWDVRVVVSRQAGPGFLGITVEEITAERARTLGLAEERGVEVRSVEPGSPAAKAGLAKGDAILECNGQRVEGTAQFSRLVRETPPERQARLLVSRSGATQTLTMTVAARRSPAWRGRGPVLGVDAMPLEGQLADYFGIQNGVLVTSVNRGSAAEKAGLKAGDVIVKVEDTRVAGPGDISRALRSAGSGRSVPLTVVRNRAEMTLQAALE